MTFDLMNVFDQLDDSIPVREKYSRSLLNYVGNKGGCIEEIMPLIPYRNTFVDVFGGSGVVMLNRLESNLDVFNDKHGGIAAFYRALQTKPDELFDRIQLMPHSRELFIWSKENYDKQQDDVLRAAMWYYTVQCSFAGKCLYFGRTVKGRSNIWGKIQGNLKLFDSVHERFKKVQIENLDWRTILSDYDSPETVFYLDPPYWGSNIYEHGMSKDDHKLMCDKIFTLKGFVALSGYDNDIYNNYPWTDCHVIDLKQKVAAAAFTESNNLEGKEGSINRSAERREFLWIKD